MVKYCIYPLKAMLHLALCFGYVAKVRWLEGVYSEYISAAILLPLK